MVTTRAGSRESTPAASVRGGRTTTRRQSTAPTEVGTPSARARARKPGPQATARTGAASHAYGIGSQATASRVASRTIQGFSSAFENELIEQEELDPAPEPLSHLSPVVEEQKFSGYREVSRESTPASKASSSSSTSPTALLDNSKSFSHQREGGLRDVPTVHFRDSPEQIPNPPQGPTLQERLDAAIDTAGDAFKVLVNGAKAFLADYWKVLLGLLLALTFGSLLAAYGIPTLDRLLPSRPVSGPDYPHHGGGGDSTTTIVSYIPAPSADSTLSNRVRHLESRLTHLEDTLRTIPLTTKTAFNHISAALGATIIPSFTSPTKRTVSSLLIPLGKLWTPPGMKGPLTALSPWTEPGECWCTPADRASLGVRAAYPLRPVAFTIEHVTPQALEESGHDLSTAPSVVEVWARSAAAGGGDCVGKAPEAKGWACLGRVEMRAHTYAEEIGAWTGEVAAGGGEVIEAQEFVFLALENRGNPRATCLYRVLLHGEKVA